MHDLALDKKKLLFIGGGLVGVLILLIIAGSLIGRRPLIKKQTAEKPPVKNDASKQIEPPKSSLDTTQYPVVTVKQWTEGKAPQKTVAQARIYHLKPGIRRETAEMLSEKFVGTKEVKQREHTVVGTRLGASSQDIALFIANLKTGEFSYAASGDTAIAMPQALSFPSPSPQEQVTNFLQSIFNDPTVQITASYQKKSKPGITYFEAHRDWKQTGLPILNAFGILNLPENQTLGSLTLTTSNDRPADPDVFATTDASDGKTRQTDFNTVTIALDTQKNAVVSLTSNLKAIDASRLSTKPLISYTAALNKLKNKEYEFLYTVPAGRGSADFAKVYPNNKALADEAVIDEAIITYLEEPPGIAQTKLDPYYLFHGTAKLTSGYKVKFVAAVPAVSIGKTAQTLGVNIIAQDKTQKQGSLNLTITPSPTERPETDPTQGPIPTSAQATPVPTFDSFEVCGSTWNNIRKLPNGVIIGQNLEGNNVIEGSGGGDRLDWYILSPIPSKPISEFTNQLTAFDDLDKLVDEIYIFTDAQNITLKEDPNPGGNQASKDDPNVRFKRGKSLPNSDLTFTIYNSGDSRYKNKSSCPIRITGISPTLFIYGDPGESVKISPKFLLSYADPGLKNGQWNVFASPTDYLYYEYDNTQVSFSPPPLGWNRHKKELPAFAQSIARDLGLNALESERLLFELNHAARDVNSDNLFIGLIPEDEVNAKLPLTFHASRFTFHVSRIHFYLSQAKENVIPPLVTPVKRSSSMIFELGAYGDLLLNHTAGKDQ